MAKTLIAYFSTHGTTGKVARELADATGGDLFEIVPVEPYSNSDLNWHDKASRSSVEMSDDACRPAIATEVENISGYDVIYLGFPIWWYREPRIIDSFVEAYDLAGKTIVPFCTSGSSPIGKTAAYLRELAPKADVRDGQRFSGNTSAIELADWVAKL